MKIGPIRLLLVAAFSAIASPADEASNSKTGRESVGVRIAKAKPSPIPKSAPRERAAKDLPSRSKPDHEQLLRKARALAKEVERVIGLPLALSENDPKELATEIRAMEMFLADHRKGAQIRAIPSFRTERGSASDEWWRNQQTERAAVQQRQSEIERWRIRRDTEERQRRQEDYEFRRR